MYKLDVVFEVLGAGDPNLDFKVTTLGFTATIMILYNMVAWPYIQQQSYARPPIRMIHCEEERIAELCAEMDMVVDFCSDIMIQVKSLASPNIKITFMAVLFTINGMA